MALKCRLKYILLDKELRAQELARMLGVSDGEVSRWASGRRAPSLERAIQIARVLGVKVEDIWEPI
jgi:putative transcriptional regulator